MSKLCESIILLFLLQLIPKSEYMGDHLFCPSSALNYTIQLSVIQLLPLGSYVGQKQPSNSEVFTNYGHLFTESPQIPLKHPSLSKSSIHLELLTFGYGNYLILFNANIMRVNRNHTKAHDSMKSMQVL